jgi:hypothetical protein
VSNSAWCGGCGEPRHKCHCEVLCARCPWDERDHTDAMRFEWNDIDGDESNICDSFVAPSPELIAERRDA